MGCKLVQLPCDTVIEYDDCRFSSSFFLMNGITTACVHTPMKPKFEMNNKSVSFDMSVCVLHPIADC